ncbi:hypothetical protein NH8B_1770 [Pseudogulbenkiania sp. NH8B]|nr:hypothetical protein NH8B_1770 [Pseudogulbenkiania sp. NH8B]
MRLYQSQALHPLFERVFHRAPVLDSLVVHVESLMHPVLHLLACQWLQSWRHHKARQRRLGWERYWLRERWCLLDSRRDCLDRPPWHRRRQRVPPFAGLAWWRRFRIQNRFRLGPQRGGNIGS